MTTIMKSIRRIEYGFDRCAQRFAVRHPFAAISVMFIGLPIFILLAVTACTAVAVLPVALIFGWL